MTAVAILADQHFRRGLLAAPGLLPQPIRRLQECSAFCRHVVVGRALQDVARLAFQGAVVQRGAPLEAVHHVRAPDALPHPLEPLLDQCLRKRRPGHPRSRAPAPARDEGGRDRRCPPARSPAFRRESGRGPGCGLSTVARMLGHSDPTMAPRCAHVGARDVQAAAERIGKVIQAAMASGAPSHTPVEPDRVDSERHRRWTAHV